MRSCPAVQCRRCKGYGHLRDSCTQRYGTDWSWRNASQEVSWAQKYSDWRSGEPWEVREQSVTLSDDGQGDTLAVHLASSTTADIGETSCTASSEVAKGNMPSPRQDHFIAAEQFISLTDRLSKLESAMSALQLPQQQQSLCPESPQGATHISEHRQQQGDGWLRAARPTARQEDDDTIDYDDDDDDEEEDADGDGDVLISRERDLIKRYHKLMAEDKCNVHRDHDLAEITRIRERIKERKMKLEKRKKENEKELRRKLQRDELKAQRVAGHQQSS